MDWASVMSPSRIIRSSCARREPLAVHVLLLVLAVVLTLGNARRQEHPAALAAHPRRDVEHAQQLHRGGPQPGLLPQLAVGQLDRIEIPPGPARCPAETPSAACPADSGTARPGGSGRRHAGSPAHTWACRSPSKCRGCRPDAGCRPRAGSASRSGTPHATPPDWIWFTRPVLPSAIWVTSRSCCWLAEPRRRRRRRRHRRRGAHRRRRAEPQ